MNLDLFHQWARWLLPKLADHLLQSTLIGLFVLLVVHLLNNQSARPRHILLVLGMAKFLFPSALLIASVEFLGIAVEGLAPSTSSAIAVSYLQPSVWLELREGQPVAPAGEALSKEAGVYLALALVWLLGYLFLVFMWARRRRTVKTLLDKTPTVSAGREAEALRRVSGWMLLTRPVELAMTPGFMEPGVWGVRKPVLVLAQGMTREMTDSELESVLLHELIHVDRHDNLMASVQRTLCYLFWFHPLVWILDQKLLLERERVCDELVLNMRIDRNVYAASIVKVTRFCLGGKLTGASCVTGEDLKRRLEMILRAAVLVRFTIWHTALLVTVACGIMAFSLAVGAVGYPLSGLLRAQTLDLKDESQGATLVSPLRWWDSEQDPKIVEDLRQAPEVAMNIQNDPGCPLIVTNARLRWLEDREAGGEFAVQFGFALSNVSNRRTKRFVARPFLPDREKFPSEQTILLVIGRALEPFDKLEVPMESGLRLTGRPEALTIRIETVEFEDGTSWRRIGNPRLDAKQTIPEPSRVRVGGSVQSANLISRIEPMYPRVARQDRIQGEVILEAVISPEGVVRNLTVVSGHRLLVDSALTAVGRWKYKPTLLNGRPVEVVTQVSVPFRLEPDNL